MKGYIYLIRNIEDSTYKIGVTKHNPLKRLKQLQTGSSSQLDLVYSIEADYPYRLEKMLHTHFSLQRKNNEWFSLDLDSLMNFPETCNKLLNIIKSLETNPYFMQNIH
jgi:hypothetical protein